MAITFRQLMAALGIVAQQAEESAQHLSQQFIIPNERGLSLARERHALAVSDLSYVQGEIQLAERELAQLSSPEEIRNIEVALTSLHEEANILRTIIDAKEKLSQQHEQALKQAEELHQWQLELAQLLRRPQPLLEGSCCVAPSSCWSGKLPR